MTIFNVKVSEDKGFEATVIDKNNVNIKTRSVISIYDGVSGGGGRGNFVNFPPILDNAIVDQHVALTGILKVDVSNTFSDIDTDRRERRDLITITPISTDASICSAHYVNGEIILTGYSLGQVTVNVTAKDLWGGEATDSFIVNVYAIVWVGVSTSVGAGQYWLFELNSSNGSVLSSFNATEIVFPESGRMKSMASVDFDKSDNTLWFNDNQPTVGERLFHTKLDGTLLSVVDTSGLVTRPGGVSADKSDDSLWFVSNPDNKVYNTNREVTTVLSSFSFGDQIEGLALDDDGTLWISDLQDDIIYNITKSGQIISSFSVTDISGGGSVRVDCIGVSRWDDSLWLVNGADVKLHNVSKQGVSLNTPINLFNLTPSITGIRGLSVSS